jgi:beta-galactosidase
MLLLSYTTDGAAVENLENGSLQGCGVYTAIDFPTGSDPSSAFALQKHYNPAGMSPPLSAEFYTGWLTHWGERIAQTDAASTASDLDHVLSLNASVVLYMVHGGTSFGFQSGANTGAFSFDFQPDITSYDYVSFDLRTDG